MVFESFISIDCLKLAEIFQYLIFIILIYIYLYNIYNKNRIVKISYRYGTQR